MVSFLREYGACEGVIASRVWRGMKDWFGLCLPLQSLGQVIEEIWEAISVFELSNCTFFTKGAYSAARM